MKKLLLIVVVAGIGYAYQDQLLEISGLTETSTVYRYQDEQGQWHYSDQRPAGNSAEAFEVPLNSNVLSEPPNPDHDARRDLAPSEPDLVEKVLSYFRTLSKGDKVIEDAKQVRQQSEARQQALDNLTN